MGKRRPNNSALDNDPIHQAVLKHCVVALIDHKCFSKAKILSNLTITVFSDGGENNKEVPLDITHIGAAVYWDYIRYKIENSGFLTGKPIKLELMPVSTKFFKRHPSLQGQTSLNSYLAGPGGKSAGYALATIENGVLALAKIDLRVKQHQGTRKSIRAQADNMKKLLELDSNQAVATAIENKAKLAFFKAN
jgi:hypothetical protein